MANLKTVAIAAFAIACMNASPALAQGVDGDANSRLVQWGRMLAEPGTFWLDSNDDIEIMRYKKERDVTLCLDRDESNPDLPNYPLQITWDDKYTAVLRAGNCYYFDAMKVMVRPAEEIPEGATLRGLIMTR